MTTRRNVGPDPTKAPRAAAIMESHIPAKAYHVMRVAASVISLGFCESGMVLDATPCDRRHSSI